MKKSKKILSAALVAGIIAVLTPQCVLPVLGSSVENVTTLFEGEQQFKTWQTAVTFNTIKNGGTFDPSKITEGGCFKAVYTGDKEGLQIVLQDYQDGEKWVTLVPNDVITDNDGKSVAIFDYESIVEKYGSDFSVLDSIHIVTTTGAITLYSFGYVEENTEISDVVVPENPTARKIALIKESIDIASNTQSAPIKILIRPGRFNPRIISRQGYFKVTYKNSRSSLRLVFQSWTGSGKWVVVSPTYITKDASKEYTAYFEYESIAELYGDNFSQLDAMYLMATEGDITVDSFEYITKGIKDVREALGVDPGDEETRLLNYTFSADEEYVRVLGRTYEDRTGARYMIEPLGGVEFTFTGTELSIDVSVERTFETQNARIGVFVDGERVKDFMVDEKLKSVPIFKYDEPKTVTVKVVKLSESAGCIVSLDRINTVSYGEIKPTKAHERKMEVIGDSITCGYGIDNPDWIGGFSTDTEDASKAYAYKAAEMLDADVNLFASGGFGVLSGYTTSDEINTQLTTPYCYGGLGFSYFYTAIGESPSYVPWNFASYQPDVVVVNLGTNDFSYTKDIPERRAAFTAEYVKFLTKIRKYNKNSEIICTLGIMGAELYPEIQQAVDIYKEQSGDTKVSCMQFAQQLEEDGICLDEHPSELTNEKAAKQLSDYIKEKMNW